MKRLEQEEQIALLKWASLYNDIAPFLIHIRNEGKRSLREGSIAKKMGLKKGVCDLFFARPSKNFHGFWIELKVGNNKLKKVQKEFMQRMKNENYQIGVFWSWTDAAKAISHYLEKKYTI